jgi:hypothetical protein
VAASILQKTVRWIKKTAWDLEPRSQKAVLDRVLVLKKSISSRMRFSKPISAAYSLICFRCCLINYILLNERL